MPCQHVHSNDCNAIIITIIIICACKRIVQTTALQGGKGESFSAVDLPDSAVRWSFIGQLGVLVYWCIGCIGWDWKRREIYPSTVCAHVRQQDIIIDFFQSVLIVDILAEPNYTRINHHDNNGSIGCIKYILRTIPLKSKNKNKKSKKKPVPSWKSRSMRDNTGYHTIHGIRPNDFFFENGFNPSPSPPKTAAATFSFFSSSLPLFHITSLHIPPQFHLLVLVSFLHLLILPASLYCILNPLFGFYPRNQRSSISFLQLNRCCSES